jgi:hypothetical protein
MNYTALKNEIARLRQIAPKNVTGVSLGYKETAGQRTSTVSIIFRVEKKEAIAELKAADVIPPSLTIAGETYPTDIVESPVGSIQPHVSCFNHVNPQETEIARLRGQAGALVPMRGGQEISALPFASFTGGMGNIGYAFGTLGLFAIDNEDNRVVGVTNTHVAMGDMVYYAKDVGRPLNVEVLDTKNTIEPRFSNVDGKKYPYGATIRDKSDFHTAVRFIKRYVPLRSTPQTLLEPDAVKQTNLADAALLIMDNGTLGNTGVPFVGPYSYSIRRPTDIESADVGAPPYYPFATKDELDALLSAPGAYVYSTGRTTGPKGYCADNKLIVSEVGVEFSVGYNGYVAPFSECFAIAAASDATDDEIAGRPGDSGSAVIADVPPVGATGPAVPKIIGLLFAGPNSENADYGKKSFICRIDYVAESLNIRAWDAAYVFNPTTSLSIPTPRVVTEDLAGVNGKGTDLFTTRVVNETGTPETKKYWHSGCTLQQYYSESPPTDILLSRATIYENNPIGWAIGQFSVVDPDQERGVIDVYQFSLVSGSGAADNSAFTIMANQLRAAIVFDADVKSSYSIRVRATSALGESIEKSFTINVADLMDVIVTGFAGTAGNQQVSLTWNAPTGLPPTIAITGYNVQHSADNGSTWSTVQVTAVPPAPAATTTTITGLTNGVAHKFRVAVVTSVGQGPDSPQITLTPRTVPDAPTNLTGVVGNAQIALAWDAPAQNGGAAITDYVVEVYSFSTQQWTTFSDGTSSAQSAVVTGLINNASYSFRVSAVNVAGTSSPSVEYANVLIQPIATNVTAIANIPNTPTAVSLTWTAPSGNNSNILRYDVESSGNGGSSWTILDQTITTTSAVVPNLTETTAYIFRVAAVDIFNTKYAYSAVSDPVTPGAPKLTFFGASMLTNEVSGATIGEVSANSVVEDDSFTFALVPGPGDTYNSSFEFNGSLSSSSATLKLAAPITIAGVVTVRIRVTNSLDLTDEAIAQITVQAP